ncbi:MAG: esterase family protein, partial [Actinomycetota bacterium]|nr:esterase family protein [Actinomycetota bacterium]
MRGRVAIAVLAALACAAPARAADRNCQLDPNPPPASDRIVAGEIDGHPYNVLLPAGYASSNRRYPVLYLLPGRQYSEHSWLRKSDVAEFTKDFTGDRAAIVVTPSMGADGWALDYHDGSQDWERYAFEKLIPHIDARFRTIADGAHRAVAGFSAGGAGALRWAAHRPDMFAAVGGFSAPVTLVAPDEPYAGPGEVEPSRGAGSPGPPRTTSADPYAPPKEGCNSGGDATGRRVDNGWFWHGNDAGSLAVNLRGLGVYFSSGNGASCGPQDARDPVLLAPSEPGVREVNEQFDVALTAAGVPHTYDRLPCGVHNMVTAELGLHAFWDLMTRSFGRRAPRSFDYRSVFADATAWGWTFRADARRAPEFLEVRGASAEGLTLIGSGTETVVTPRLFEPGARVRVEGAAPATATADAEGRLTVAVDLGEPAASPQFSGGERRWTARRVRFAEPPASSTPADFPAQRPCESGGTLTIRLKHPGRRSR